MLEGPLVAGISLIRFTAVIFFFFLTTILFIYFWEKTFVTVFKLDFQNGSSTSTQAEGGRWTFFTQPLQSSCLCVLSCFCVGGTTDGWGPVEGHGDRRMVLQSSTPRPINALAASFTTPLTISYAPAYGLGLSIFWNQVR